MLGLSKTNLGWWPIDCIPVSVFENSTYNYDLNLICLYQQLIFVMYDNPYFMQDWCWLLCNMSSTKGQKL